MTNEVKAQNVAKMLDALIDCQVLFTCSVTLLQGAGGHVERKIREALAAPARNCDKPEFSTPEQALAALKYRFPIEGNFPGFKMAVEWMLDTQDYRIAEPVSRRFGQQPKEGGAE